MSTTTFPAKYTEVTGNHRLVGWGDWETMSESVLPRVFGWLVMTATPVVREFHGDLFHDAEWLRAKMDEHFTSTSMPFRFEVCVRYSGTNLNVFGDSFESARAVFTSAAYNAALYLFEVHVDGRGEWTLSIDLLDARPDRS